jgi:hypothetical protein
MVTKNKGFFGRSALIILYAVFNENAGSGEKFFRKGDH